VIDKTHSGYDEIVMTDKTKHVSIIADENSTEEEKLGAQLEHNKTRKSIRFKWCAAYRQE
jgi:hypothetical protein